MINREWQTVTVRSYTSGVDSYGQERQLGHTDRNVQMVCKIYSQQNVNSPLYNEVELIGITKDFEIHDNNHIIINNVTYNILHTIPSSRYNQVLMKKAK